MAWGLAASSSCRCASTPSFWRPGSSPSSDDTSLSTSWSVIVSVSCFGFVTTQWSPWSTSVFGGVHPVQGLVGATIGVDRHASVGLHHDQPVGLREVGIEPTGVVDRAAGDDETHGWRRYREAGAFGFDVVADASLDQLAVALAARGRSSG